MTLPPVKFNKVSQDHAQALQSLVMEYIVWETNDLEHLLSARFYDALQQIALLTELYLIIRAKIESRKAKFSLSFKTQQAIALLYACSHGHKKDQSFRDMVAMMFIDEIHQQLLAIKTQAAPQTNIYKSYLDTLNTII